MSAHPLCIFVLATMLPVCAKAEIPCPPMPGVSTTVTKDVKGDIDVQVGRLGPVKAGEIGIKADVAAKAVFEKFPNIDRLVVLQTMTATYCVMLREDDALTATEKLKRWETFQLKVLNLNSASTPNDSPGTTRVASQDALPSKKAPPPKKEQPPTQDQGGEEDSDWGAITTSTAYFNFRQLQLLTNNADDIGAVSGKANDKSGTGVLFHGHIHQSKGTGEVQIGIWDSVAAGGGLPFAWRIPVVQTAPTPSENGAEVYLQTGKTVFRFNGDFENSMWTGTVEREDLSTGKRTFIGNFEIIACKIFDCDD
jgi:hypothetical protein